MKFDGILRTIWNHICSTATTFLEGYFSNEKYIRWVEQTRLDARIQYFVGNTRGIAT